MTTFHSVKPLNESITSSFFGQEDYIPYSHFLSIFKREVCVIKWFIWVLGQLFCFFLSNKLYDINKNNVMFACLLFPPLLREFNFYFSSLREFNFKCKRTSNCDLYMATIAITVRVFSWQPILSYRHVVRDNLRAPMTLAPFTEWLAVGFVMNLF